MIRTASLIWGTILAIIGGAAAGKVIYTLEIASRLCGTILAPACKTTGELIAGDTYTWIAAAGIGIGTFLIRSFYTSNQPEPTAGEVELVIDRPDPITDEEVEILIDRRRDQTDTDGTANAEAPN